MIARRQVHDVFRAAPPADDGAGENVTDVFQDFAATFGIADDFDDPDPSAADPQDLSDGESCPWPACGKTRNDGRAIARRVDDQNV
ncbi:MAG TPA: hypothetical protein VKB93_17355 [Thermoanaerobaculia bacterium]|nr:hypothetical protein [Thermoanaerobaculia bacterium]